MANPTLKGGTDDGNKNPDFKTSGSRTLTLFNIENENFAKSANFININLPLGDSEDTIIFNLLGTTRNIRLRGVVTSSDATVGDFVFDLNNLITGQQGDTGADDQVGYIYTPQSISGATGGTGTVAPEIRVFVNDVSWDFDAGNPGSIKYSITLFEASNKSV